MQCDIDHATKSNDGLTRTNQPTIPGIQQPLPLIGDTCSFRYYFAMSKILKAGPVSRDITVLDDAWQSPETFAFLPDKLPSMSMDIPAVLDSLDAPYRSGHFALLTSGTTGEPKLVFGSKERAENLVRVLHDCQKSEPVTESIVSLPLTYCFSFVNQYLWSRVVGRRLSLTEGFAKPDELETALASAQDAMLCLTGVQVPLLMKYFSGREFPGVIRIHFAGGRFPADKLPALRESFPNAQVFNNYGCAEALPRLTVRAAEAATEPSHVGWPLPGVELKTSADGSLMFRSEYGAVAQADRDGFRPITAEDWVATGDLGEQKGDGHLELTARSSEVFKRFGEKISIPSVLGCVSDVWADSVGTYRERDANEEDGYVLVVSPQPDTATVRGILGELRKNFSRAHWPLRIESVPDLPYLSNGKVDQAGLKNNSNLTQLWRQRI